MATSASVPVTLGDIFRADRGRGLGGRGLAEPDKARLTAALRVRPQVGLSDVESEMGNAYASALSTRLLDIFLGAWSKLSEVASLAEGPRARPGERHLVPIARHTITSRHEPKVEVLVDNVAALQIPLEVRLAAQFETAVLAVEAGHVLAVRAGSFQATGAVACRGITLASVNSQRFQLPAEISLTPPFPISRLSAGERTALAPPPARPEPVRAMAAQSTRSSLLLTGSDPSGRPLRFVLQAGPGAGEAVWTLGRRPGRADLVIAHASVSGEHARLRYRAGHGAEICDLGSANGTFVDGQRIGAEFTSIDGARKIALGAVELTLGRG